MARGDHSHPKPPADRSVKSVVLGDLLFKTWFHSIYPEELVGKDTDRLYVCPWCFRYSCNVDAYTGHMRVCPHRTSPPGTKIYEHGGYAVWELDGEKHKLFAQNLSLFAKLFLDHKSVFFDVASFLYYILTYTDPQQNNNPRGGGGYHVLGYFSKEKLSWDANNLACILIFPPYQHKQLGKLLMGVSYKLSAWEWEGGSIGGPERPLSEMGRRSYCRFWEERIARYFLLGPPGSDPDESVQHKQDQQNGAAAAAAGKGANGKKRPARERMTVRDIGLATGMLTEDVITALKGMGVVEPEKAGKKRKRTTSPSGRDGGDDVEHGETVTIRKSNVLEWAKIHNVSLRDPVRDEGFLGEWAPEKLRRKREEQSQSD